MILVLQPGIEIRNQSDLMSAEQWMRVTGAIAPPTRSCRLHHKKPPEFDPAARIHPRCDPGATAFVGACRYGLVVAHFER